MQSIAIILIFVGMFIITHGVYAEKLRMVEQSVRVEHRFIPRTYLEEQHAEPNLSGTFKNMFEGDSSWMPERGNDSSMMSAEI